jgi:hypothetical protein
VSIHVDQKTIEVILRNFRQDTSPDNHDGRIGFLTGRVEGNEVYVEGVLFRTHIPGVDPNIEDLSQQAIGTAVAWAIQKRTRVVGVMKFVYGTHYFEPSTIASCRRMLTAKGTPDVSLIMNPRGTYRTYP